MQQDMACHDNTMHNHSLHRLICGCMVLILLWHANISSLAAYNFIKMLKDVEMAVPQNRETSGSITTHMMVNA